MVHTVSDEERFNRLAARLAPGLALVRLLGEGSMARVYLAWEPALHRAVAVKVLREEVASREVASRRFEREARAIAAVRHPNITAVYRIGHLDDGAPYIVMEYIAGRRLEAILESRGPLDVAEACRVLTAVAGALDAAHRKGVVHRDLRPDNLMVETETGRIVLTDFGLAALVEPDDAADTKITRPGERIGDLTRMSPEQRLGQPVTAASDMYAFGLLIYELLTGETPFARLKMAALLAGPPGEPPPLETLRPEAGPALADLARRCLATSPEHRPLASEAREELTRAAAPRDGLPAAFPMLDEFWRELKRRKVVRVGAAYVAAGFLLLQGTQLVLDGLPLARPDAWYGTIVTAVLLGFPLALMLSWVYDFTSAGIRRTDPDPDDSRARWTRLALPLAGLMLSLLAALLLWRWLVG